MTKINWNEIKESNILILKEKEPAKVKFLDNGSVDVIEILDKRTEKLKKVNKFTFKVIDLNDNTEKEISTLSSRLMNQLKEHLPLKDKSFNIMKFSTGYDDFDKDFKVNIIE